MRLQVGPHAEVEVGLALPAHRRGQVEDHVGRHRGIQSLTAWAEQFEQVTFDPGDQRVGGQVRRQRRPVGQHQLADGLGGVAVHRDRSGAQQLTGQAGAEEPRAPSNQYVHH